MKDRAAALADLGAKLKAIREEKGLSLEDVTETTKIRTNFLEDIENGNYGNFPGSVYVRGFVKSYLHVLDADNLWPEFKPYLFSEEIVGTPDIMLGDCIPPTKGFKQTSRLWLIIVLLMMIAGFGWYGLSVWSSPDRQFSSLERTAPPVNDGEMATVAEKISEPSEQPVIQSVSTEISKDEEPSLSALATMSADADETMEKIGVSPDISEIKAVAMTAPRSVDKPESEPVIPTLSISTRRNCWVKLSGLEKTIFQGIIAAGSTKEFKITEKTKVVYGRPGSLEVSFGGKSLGQPGKAGTVARWFYSPNGSSSRIEE